MKYTVFGLSGDQATLIWSGEIDHTSELDEILDDVMYEPDNIHYSSYSVIPGCSCGANPEFLTDRLESLCAECLSERQSEDPNFTADRI